MDIEGDEMADEGHNGIAGYASSSALESLAGSSTIDLQLEPGSDKVVFRVKAEDVEQVISGQVEGDATFVQILLKPGATVDTRIQMLRDIKSLQDPTLVRLTAAAVSTVSSVAPN